MRFHKQINRFTIFCKIEYEEFNCLLTWQVFINYEKPITARLADIGFNIFKEDKGKN